MAHHGLSYAAATWGEVSSPTGPRWDTQGSCELVVELTNDADRPVSEVVQVYLHDPVASVVRPVQQLVGVARVDLEVGTSSRVRFRLHADLTSFTGRDLVRIGPPDHIGVQPIEAVVEASGHVRFLLILDDHPVVARQNELGSLRGITQAAADTEPCRCPEPCERDHANE